MTAWNEAAALPDKTAAPARLDDAYAAWDKTATAIDEVRKKQMAAPGLGRTGEESARHPRPRMGRPWPRTATSR